MPTRPLIGLTLDAEQPGGWSKYPWYALRQNYAAAVAAAGGLAVALPHDPALADAYLDRLDGLIVTGGAFDVDPALYGDTETARNRRPQSRPHHRRAGPAARRAWPASMPVLGICGGQQLLAVALGGTLIQHIPDSIAAPLAHEQANPRIPSPSHEVAITPGTLLHRIVGTATMRVNSAHHQAVRAPGRARAQRHRARRRHRRHRGPATNPSASACNGTPNTWSTRATPASSPPSSPPPRHDRD